MWLSIFSCLLLFLMVYSSEGIQVGNVGSAAGVIVPGLVLGMMLVCFVTCDLKSLLTDITSL